MDGYEVIVPVVIGFSILVGSKAALVRTSSLIGAYDGDPSAGIGHLEMACERNLWDLAGMFNPAGNR
jgi:hypothetical protein